MPGVRIETSGISINKAYCVTEWQPALEADKWNLGNGIQAVTLHQGYSVVLWANWVCFTFGWVVNPQIASLFIAKLSKIEPVGQIWPTESYHPACYAACRSWTGLGHYMQYTLDNWAGSSMHRASLVHTLHTKYRASLATAAHGGGASLQAQSGLQTSPCYSSIPQGQMTLTLLVYGLF